MRSNFPISPDFWQEYQQFMKSTFDNTQNMLNQMTNSMDPVSCEDNCKWVNDVENIQSPDIRINDEYVTVTFKHNQRINKNNVKIFLDGYQLAVQGDIEAKVPLPVAVQKYGARAVVKDNVLEITLLKDKYNYKQEISITGD